MVEGEKPHSWKTFVLAMAWGVLTALPASGQLNLGSEQLIQAAGSNIIVPEYSVPRFVDWNDDGINDLVIGEGGSDQPGKIRIYLNVGTAIAPQFTTYHYVQSAGADLAEIPGACLGVSPCVVYWDSDDHKDLVNGLSDGTVKLYLNVGTNDDPTFDSGTLLQYGEPGAKINIDVGMRAIPDLVDWNNDGKKDLIVGAYDGRIHIFINEGLDTAPDFHTVSYTIDNGQDLVVPFTRSSPHILDVNNDSLLDIVTGNTEGNLLLYVNVGTATAPSFAGYVQVESDCIPINLGGAPRSRPFVCDWRDDGLHDVLIGAGDGVIRLYEGLPPVQADFDGDQDVDTVDFDFFASCTTGPECGPPASGCEITDLDGDGDTDQSDFGLWQRCFRGEDIPVTTGCTD